MTKPFYVNIKMFDRDVLEWAAKLEGIRLFLEEERVETGDIDLNELILIFTSALAAQTSCERTETITAKAK